MQEEIQKVKIAQAGVDGRVSGLDRNFRCV